MSSECLHKNPLVRDGVSQSSRLLKALNPSYAKIDERSLLDLLTFIKKYASQLAYYDLTNKQDGTWDTFFQQNCVCLLADMANFDLEKAKKAFKYSADRIKFSTSIKKHLKNQFDLIFTVIYEAEKWLRNIDKSLKLYNEIQKEISANLSLEILKVISYYKKAKNINLINTSDFDSNFLYDIVPAEDILKKNSFSENWFRYKDETTGLAYSKWEDYYESIPESQVYQPVGILREKAIYSQYFLQKSFDKILSTYTRLLGNIDFFLEDMLKNYPSHEPHVGLLLSFLQIFKYAQNQINTLTQRHLDFYLKDVLGLKKMKAVANKAHIIFELAKGVDSYKVLKDTALSAGKDNTGKEILFYTLNETVFNKAGVCELRNIYIDKDNDDRIYASPYADSPDGLGSEFLENPGKWKPFGESQNNLITRTMPDASVGFMIASETFQMSEGNRTLIIDIHCDFNPDDIEEDLKKTAFNCYISGKEGWIERLNLKNKTSSGQSPNINYLLFSKDLIQLKLKIKTEEDPIVALDSKIHDTRFDVKIPAVFLECSHSKNKYIYRFLKEIKIEKIKITVSSDKTKNLLLQNDQSVIDPSKPFNPFGTIPKVSSSFIIGSKEVFNKKLTKLNFHATWNEFPSVDGITKHYELYNKEIDHHSFKVTTKRLVDGQWMNMETGKDLFSGNKNSAFNLTFYNNSNNPLKGSDVNELPKQYNMTAKGGFVKIELEDFKGFAFGHQMYPEIYTKAAILNAKAIGGSELLEFPKPPYTPAMKDFYLEYTAEAEIKFGSNITEEEIAGKFFQVYPFGYKEITTLTNSEELFLLPQFAHEEDSSENGHNGELLIGFDNVNPPTSLNLLFKVAEGSENPDLPSQSVNWFYLKDDEWTAFESTEILADNTKNLTTTGILSLSVPRFKSLKSKFLGKDLLWIMASISKNTNAACQIIKIHPQAVLAEFKDNKNDPLQTGTILNANSISKPKVKDPNVKSVNQPYASFGGKIKEVSENFYLRTAERMRHKNRGITIWDYERIILQEFPDLYKVKCINHSVYGYNDLVETEMNSEFAPGYVTIIVVPKTYNQNAINPYEPKVTKARILQIEEVIKERISPFAARKLKILNPLYEQIQLDFEVEFHKQYTDRGYYEKQLNEDLKKYLSPWAYSEGKDMIVGGRMYKSAIIDFIEELTYVDYVKNVKMNHYKDNILYKSDINTAHPTEARSVFATINNTDILNEHIIKEIT